VQFSAHRALCDCSPLAFLSSCNLTASTCGCTVSLIPCYSQICEAWLCTCLSLCGPLFPPMCTWSTSSLHSAFDIPLYRGFPWPDLLNTHLPFSPTQAYLIHFCSNALSLIYFFPLQYH
jgi:hypothetical protein